MKKRITLFFLSILTIGNTSAQSFTVEGSEIGVDLAFSASSNGGNVGLGLKYGLNIGEHLIVGPSIRYEYLWWKNYVGLVNSSSGNRHLYGGGVFTHFRFLNYFFLGMEFEVLKSPYAKPGLGFTSGAITQEGSWAPTLFLGGGFSMEVMESFRVNVGIMYDVINAENSPFRKSYSIQKKTAAGQPAGFLPIIGRIAFFFPLGRE